MSCAICERDHEAAVSCPTFVGKAKHGSGTLALSEQPAPEVATPAPDPLIGTSIGSFRIVRPLGRGGMGMVYLGENTVIGSKVAVKFIHDHLACHPELVARFYAEARAVNLIGHENIVNIFDMAVAKPNRPYFIMEYLVGPSLSQLARGPVSPEVAIPILMQVCEALQAAHSHGVVHRDLKPENVVLVKRGRRQHFVKILDFGIAKLLDNDAPPNQTSAGVIIGTPEFMAPEQCNGERVDGRTDLYALGVIAYLLATGRLPFEGGGLTGLLLAHREQVAPAPHAVNPEVSPAWSALIMRALAKKPDDRFHDAGEMYEALERVLNPPPRFTPAPPPRLPTPEPVPAVVGPSWTVAPSAARSPSPDLEATVSDLDGTPRCRLRCIDLSRGGLYLCADAAFPPLCSRLKIALDLPSGSFNAIAEVVRHVDPDQARTWNMPAGFFLRFEELTPALQEAIARYAKGGVAPKKAPSRDDAGAERVLERYRRRGKGDPYTLLDLGLACEMSEVAARGREARRELELLFEKPLSGDQRAQAEAARARVSQALSILGSASARAAFDAERGDYQGVARCISAGLTVTEAERLRREHQAKHPGHQARSQIGLATARSYESQGAHPQALAAYEEALRVDPLSVELHKLYWGLRRKVSGTRG
ncbi:MAG: serine/threonine-protein kinase [Myxococcaceae bacterium]